MNYRISDVKDYFDKNYSYVDLGGIEDDVILKYLGQSYVINLSFERKMDCLYDYILSNDLTEVSM